MPKQTVNHTTHNKMREFPRRELIQLTVAAFQAGPKDIKREWPADGLWDETANRWHWFDLAGQHNDNLILFDFEPGYWNSRPTKPELERSQQKKTWAELNKTPLMVVEHGHTTLELTILIRKFLMEIKNEQDNI